MIIIYPCPATLEKKLLMYARSNRYTIYFNPKPPPKSGGSFLILTSIFNKVFKVVIKDKY